MRSSPLLEDLWNFFIEITCAYGLKPGRALLILFGLMPVFACCYGLALRKADRRAGIWVTYSADRTYKRRDVKREWQARMQQGFWIPFSQLTDRRDKRRDTKREWRALAIHRQREKTRNALTEAGWETIGGLSFPLRLPRLLSRLRSFLAIKAAIFLVCPR